MSNIINIIGHKSPDLDSVASAVAYAYLKNKIDSKNNYIPSVAGAPNLETKYAFEKFDIELPEILNDATDKKIILVDHNEKSQTVDGIDNAKIISIIDHHKMKFEYDDPIFIHIEPIGSTCTIITKMFKCHNVEITKGLAGILLSGVLVDTVITKSPTSTQKDIEAIKELSSIAGVDHSEFGIELFKIRSNVSSLPPKEIIENDCKDFDINGKNINIGQVETVDLKEFNTLKEDIFKAMKIKKEKGNYNSVILFITDILKEGSQFLVLSDEPERFEKSFNVKLENGECYLDGIMSRKKQVVPVLMKNY